MNQPHPDVNGPDRRALTVLVVEDEPTVATLITLILQVSGYRVITCEDGETALELAARHRPDVVTLDVNLPGIDGLEVGRRLLADPRTAHALLMVVSAHPKHELDAAQGRGDVHAVLTKPFDFAKFVGVLEELLEESGLDAPLVLEPVIDLRSVPRARAAHRA